MYLNIRWSSTEKVFANKLIINMCSNDAYLGWMRSFLSSVDRRGAILRDEAMDRSRITDDW
jgi:hypothetical protein